MKDHYPSLNELAAQLKEGRDYRIRSFDRSSWATIISPHGGYIEPGTSEIAAALAGNKYNLFDFQGLRKQNALELHVTSTRFREPGLLSMLVHTQVAVSLHCMGSQKQAVTWLGGRNLGLKKLVLANLLKRGFAVNPDSPLYRGESKANIVNLACEEGVQLELSSELMQKLFCGAPFRKVRAAKRSPAFDHYLTALTDALAQFEEQSKSAA